MTNVPSIFFRLCNQWLFIVLMGVLTLSGCDRDDYYYEVFCLPDDSIASIQISPKYLTTKGSSEVRLATGNTQQYVAMATYLDGEIGDITEQVLWRSSDINSITIDNFGLATAISNNASVTIIACRGDIDSNPVIVKPTSAHLTQIQITPASIKLAKGLDQQMVATGVYSDGTTANITNRVTWKSTSVSDVPVDSTGLFHALNVITDVHLNAILDGITSNTANVNVTAATLETIQITPPLISISKGHQQQLDAIGHYSDNSFADLSSKVAWHSGAPNYITINSQGLADGVNVINAAVITASLNGVDSNNISMTVTPAVLTTIQITPSKLSIAKGHHQQMLAIGTYDDNTNADITNLVNWHSANTTAITVDNHGLLTAMNIASNIIVTASLTSISSNPSVINVSPAVLTSIQITPARVNLAKGLQKTLVAMGSFSDGTSANITSLVAWKSSHPTFATVSNLGVVTAVNVGTTTTIIAMLDGIDSNLSEINVTAAQLTSLQITPANISIAKGASATLTATGIYSDKTSANLTRQVTWKSTDTTSVTVNQQGIATGIQPSSNTDVTAHFDDMTSNTAVVTVTDAVLASIQITPSTISVAKGVTKQLSAIGIYSDNTKRNITDTVAWISADNTSVTVSPKGVAKGVKTTEGVKITASLTGITSNSATMAVIDAALVSIQITPAIISVPKGLTQALTAKGVYTDDTTANITNSVTWSSSNTNTVTVTAQGVAHGINITSDTQITATLNGITSNVASISVVQASLVSIQITPALIKLAKGTTQQLTAIGTYSDKKTVTITDKVTWISANTDYVTITSQGLLSAVNVRYSTTITATFQGITSNVAIARIADVILVSLQITPTSISVAKGMSQKMTAIGTYNDNSAVDLTTRVIWKSSNTTNVTITESGLAKGIAVSEETTITAFLGSTTSNTATITVTEAELFTIQITPSNLILAKGLTAQFIAVGIYSDMTTANITSSVHWVSGDISLVTITEAGLARGVNLSNGTTIVAKLNGIVSNSANMIITTAVLTSLQVTPAIINIAKGQNQPLTAIGSYSDNTHVNLTKSVAWKSSDINAVTVTKNGLASGINIATNITITAYFQDITSNNVNMTVTAAVLTSIQITPEQIVLPKGLTQQMRAIGTYSDGTTVNVVNSVSWTSTNAQTATTTVSQTGLLTGIKVANNIHLTAHLDGITSNIANITVTAAILNSIVISPSSVTLIKGLTQQMTATGIYSDGITMPLSNGIHWSSSNASNVTISTQGVLTGVTQSNTATIIAIFDGKTSNSVSVIVNAATLTSIDITPVSATVPQKNTLQMTATGHYTDSSTADISSNVSWESSDTSNITVSPAGVVNGVKQSSGTIITASSLNIISNDATITVSAPPAYYISICGGDLNDTTSSNAAGSCLKITSDHRGNWFTSSPSLTLLQALSYTQQDGAVVGGGLTYSSTNLENHIGGVNGSFGLFDQLNGAVVGVNGQADRWCQYLMSTKFAGQANWTRSSIKNLKYFNGIYHNIIAGYGWPDELRYWSKTAKSATQFSTFDLSVLNSVASRAASTDLYVTCISKSP